ELTRQRMLIPAGRNSYKLAGRTLENGNKHIIQRFQGLKYQETGPIFYKRLLLLIQTLTNSKMGYFTFIPVIDKTSITSWVKYAYKYIKQNEHQALSMLFKELHMLLNELPEQEEALFVDRLTGYKNYGKGVEKHAIDYHKNENDIQLLLTSMIHYMLDVINAESRRLPFMAFIMKDLPERSSMTHSAQKTYQLIHKEYSIEQIAYFRKLKVNTIY